MAYKRTYPRKTIPMVQGRNGKWSKVPRYGWGDEANGPAAGTSDEESGGGIGTSKGLNSQQQAGLVQGGALATGFLAGELEKNAYRDDGTVNTRDYTAAKHWEYGAKGAQMGMSAGGPWGALIGGIGGHLYGLYRGNKDGKEINRLASQNKEQEAKDTAENVRFEAEANQKRQDAYSRSYMAYHPSQGNISTSIYAKGGLAMYPLGGESTVGDPGKASIMKDAAGFPVDSTGRRLTPQEQLGYNRPGYTYGNNNGSNRLYTANYGSYKPLSLNEAGIGYNNNKSIQPYGGKPITQLPNETFEQAYQRAYGIPLKAKGGYAIPGGTLNPTSSNTLKADGNTHDDGGMTLTANGNPYAEIEGGEVMKDAKVYSDRIKPFGKFTYADIADKLGKKKGKYESKLDSTNPVTKNTAARMIQHLDKDLDGLFEHQEQFKTHTGMPGKFANGGYSSFDPSSLQGLVPLADNTYNSYLIGRTPKIPHPNKRKNFDEIANPMKTNYNIDPALTDAMRSYRMFSKNVDDNTSSSQISRANKLAGFAKLIGNRSDLYGQKENMETQLTNQDQMNRQGVANRNIKSAEGAYNTNLALVDNFNMQNYVRQEGINSAKSANMSNAVGDVSAMIQDKNLKNADHEAMLYDALKYNNGAGTAKLVGTPAMDNMIRSNSANYALIEKQLINSGQKEALANFYARYPKTK